MAKFLYTMQNVLDVKLKMEDQARTAFAEAMAVLNAEEEKLNNLIDRRTYYEAEGQRMRQAVLDIGELRDNTRALDNLKDQIAAQRKAVERAEETVERARGRLQTAMQERKTQEKLKENAFETFKKELNAAESKEIDELVSYRFGRKRMAADEADSEMIEV